MFKGYNWVKTLGLLITVLGVGFYLGRSTKPDLDEYGTASDQHEEDLQVPDESEFPESPEIKTLGAGKRLTFEELARHKSIANSPSAPSDFSYLRIHKSQDGRPTALETAVVELKPSDETMVSRWLGRSRSVTLIGAVHIADRSYYRALNAEFTRYQRVLYELVAERGTRPEPHRESGSMDLFSGFQYLLTDYFGMSHQIDEVDYRRPNFLHADLSMNELLAEGKRRGETPASIGMGMLSDLMKSYGKIQEGGPGAPPPLDFSTILSPKRLLQTMAEGMVQSGGDTGGLGQTLGPYIIEMRNAEALRIFDKEYRQGSQKLAIFYGSAHLPDMEQQLRKRYGMRRVSVRWLPAWDLTKDRDHDSGAGLGKAMPRIQQMLGNLIPRYQKPRRPPESLRQ